MKTSRRVAASADEIRFESFGFAVLIACFEYAVCRSSSDFVGSAANVGE